MAAGSPGPLERKRPSGLESRIFSGSAEPGIASTVAGALHPVVEGYDAAPLLAEGRHEGRFGEVGPLGGEVEAHHRGVGLGLLAQRVRVSLYGRDDAPHSTPVPDPPG
jgi:hypothetical protein